MKRPLYVNYKKESKSCGEFATSAVSSSPRDPDKVHWMVDSEVTAPYPKCQR